MIRVTINARIRRLFGIKNQKAQTVYLSETAKEIQDAVSPMPEDGIRSVVEGFVSFRTAFSPKPRTVSSVIITSVPTIESVRSACLLARLVCARGTRTSLGQIIEEDPSHTFIDAIDDNLLQSLGLALYPPNTKLNWEAADQYVYDLFSVKDSGDAQTCPNPGKIHAHALVYRRSDFSCPTCKKHRLVSFDVGYMWECSEGDASCFVSCYGCFFYVHGNHYNTAVAGDGITFSDKSGVVYMPDNRKRKASDDSSDEDEKQVKDEALTSLQETIRAADAARVAYIGHVETLRAKAVTLSGENDTLREDSLALREQIGTLQKQIANLAEEKKTMEESISRLQAKVKDFESSERETLFAEKIDKLEQRNKELEDNARRVKEVFQQLAK
jgi:hypothetical protein